MNSYTSRNYLLQSANSNLTAGQLALLSASTHMDKVERLAIQYGRSRQLNQQDREQRLAAALQAFCAA